MNPIEQEKVFLDSDLTAQISLEKSLLRFITCGSVDDGKSTLIGRMLFETESIFTNELEQLVNESKKYGTVNNEIDYALLVDGLSSEREQGITIDVAYRYFETSYRKFIVADTPGHEQYTRNMATGASTADAAILLVDARKGILSQTKRHSFIVSLLGVKHIIVAVNKIDLVDFDEDVFQQIKSDFNAFSTSLTFDSVEFVPVSALKGDNITNASENTHWYKGKPLLSVLENIEVAAKSSVEDFCMPIQWVNRPDSEFRGYAGSIVKGQVKPGQKIRVLPSGIETTVSQIIFHKEKLKNAEKGQSVTLTFEDEIDVSRGDVLTSLASQCDSANQFQVTLLWMSEKIMVSGRQYMLKSATQTAQCIPKTIKYQIDVNTMERVSDNKLHLNGIGVCDVYLNKALVYDAYENCKELGSFILIDKMSNETVACGWFNFALMRSNNIHTQKLTVNKQDRVVLNQHNPGVIWLTGLSGAGKSTIANALELKLNKQHIRTILLDGDNLRHGLNKDLGFTEQDRAENIRRVAEVAKLMTEAGIVCIVSFISPFESERVMAKELCHQDEFLEIFLDVSLQVAEQRDVKGLYKKARRGEIKNFTGIDSPYERPRSPDLTICTDKESIDNSVDKVIDLMRLRKII